MAENFTEEIHWDRKIKFSTITSDNLSIFIIKNKFLCTMIILNNSIWFNKLYFFNHNTDEIPMAENFTEEIHWEKKKKFSTITSDNISIFIIKNKFLCTIIILNNSIWFNKLYFFNHNTEEIPMAENFTEEIHWEKKIKIFNYTLR